MNLKLKKTIAVLVPLVGFTAAGFAIAQDAVVVTQVEPAPAIVPATEPPVLLPGEEVVVVTDAPILVADASGNPYVVAQGSTVITSTDPYRIVTPVIEIPRSVSRRSGENSREEVAIRTAPVDIRAGLSPQYLTDQSPGGT